MSTTIVDLGVPILSKILSFVPDKKSCCLVNRYFYEASCNAMESNTWLKLQSVNYFSINPAFNSKFFSPQD